MAGMGVALLRQPRLNNIEQWKARDAERVGLLCDIAE